MRLSNAKTDALMKRTADRPLASGRFSLGMGIVAGSARWPWRVVADAAHKPDDVGSGAAYSFYLRRHLHAAEARHRIGYFYRRLSRRHGPLLVGPPRVAALSGREWHCSQFFLFAVPSLHGH